MIDDTIRRLKELQKLVSVRPIGEWSNGHIEAMAMLEMTAVSALPELLAEIERLKAACSKEFESTVALELKLEKRCEEQAREIERLKKDYDTLQKYSVQLDDSRESQIERLTKENAELKKDSTK